MKFSMNLVKSEVNQSIILILNISGAIRMWVLRPSFLLF